MIDGRDKFVPTCTKAWIMTSCSTAMRASEPNAEDIGSSGFFRHQALLGGHRYVGVGILRHAKEGRDPVVICEPVMSEGTAETNRRAGREQLTRWRFVSVEEWEDGVAALAEAQRRPCAAPPEPTPKQFPTSQGTEALPEPLTSHSPAARKIALFRSLFHGRDDMYATKWLNTKTGRKGFSPVCANKWRAGVCLLKRKGRGGCAECGHRRFKPLDDAVLLRHFTQGRDDLSTVVGIYPMDERNLTWFLAIDFDKGEWKREVSCIRSICDERNVPYAVERSQSGEGAHLWLFFEEPLAGATARRFGESLLTLGMQAGGVTRFSSYDRLFPNQDTVPTGGFGNLIALPLQKRARDDGNSVFVDERFEPYPDQWAFLASVRRVTTECVRHVTALAPGGSLGVLAKPDEGIDAVDDSAGAEMPEGMGAAKHPEPASSDGDDVPNEIRIVRANMIEVDKSGLSPESRNAIRRLAAFANPDFYRAQMMRQPVYGRTRIIDLSEEDDSVIRLPRGCEDRLIALLNRLGDGEGAPMITIVDRRTQGRRIDVSFNGALRPRQQTAVDAMLRHDTGVLVAPTGFGKTVVAAGLIARRRVPTLVVLRSAALAEQWRRSLSEFLTIRETVPVKLTKTGRRAKHQPSAIGQIGDGRNEPGGIIDIALAQSLFERGDIAGSRAVKQLVRDYGMVIFDECHHVASPGHEAIARAVAARYVYGLTGTPKREDGLHPITFMECGPVRHVVTEGEQISAQRFARKLVTRFMPLHADLGSSATYNDYVSLLCRNETRNARIVEDVRSSLRQRRHPLLLTKRVDHARMLASMLDDGPDDGETGRTVLLIGQEQNASKREKLSQARAMSQDRPTVLVATMSYVSEGFDVPQLDTLFLATPSSWEGPVSQAVGRLHRDAEGKAEVRVYDYVDVGVPMLERMYRKRLKSYARLGYQLAADASIMPSRGFAEASVPDRSMVFADGYDRRLRDDINASRRTITMSCTVVSGAAVGAVEESLRDASRRGVDVAVDVRLHADASETSRKRVAAVCRRLRSAACRVRTVEWCSDFAVFDGRLVWYGGIPLLGCGARFADECSLRVVDAGLAEMLVGGQIQGTRPLV